MSETEVAGVEPIQALVRGLAVIRAFDVDHAAMARGGTTMHDAPQEGDH